MRNAKGQIGNVFFALFFILVIGIILSVFSPVIDTFRLDLINDYTPVSTENTVILIVLYALMPLLWMFYILLSAILLVLVTQAARGSPL